MKVNGVVLVLARLVVAAFAYVQQRNFNNLLNFQGAHIRYPRPTTPYVVRPGYYAPYYSPIPEVPGGSQENSHGLQQVALVLEPSQPRQASLDLPAANYNQRVWHVEQQPDYALKAAKANEDQLKVRKQWISTEKPMTGNFVPATIANHEGAMIQPSSVKNFHDIFMRYEGPQQVRFGHVETRPALRARRFEELNKGNRFRGEVMWTDKTGGYGEHHWDLVQGKL